MAKFGFCRLTGPVFEVLTSVNERMVLYPWTNLVGSARSFGNQTPFPLYTGAPEMTWHRPPWVGVMVADTLGPTDLTDLS